MGYKRSQRLQGTACPSAGQFAQTGHTRARKEHKRTRAARPGADVRGITSGTISTRCTQQTAAGHSVLPGTTHSKDGRGGSPQAHHTKYRGRKVPSATPPSLDQCHGRALYTYRVFAIARRAAREASSASRFVARCSQGRSTCKLRTFEKAKVVPASVCVALCCPHVACTARYLWPQRSFALTVAVYLPLAPPLRAFQFFGCCLRPSVFCLKRRFHPAPPRCKRLVLYSHGMPTACWRSALTCAPCSTSTTRSRRCRAITSRRWAAAYSSCTASTAASLQQTMTVGKQRRQRQ